MSFGVVRKTNDKYILYCNRFFGIMGTPNGYQNSYLVFDLKKILLLLTQAQNKCIILYHKQ